MIETLIALFAAHVLADYVFQSSKVAANKHQLGSLAIHGLFVLGTAATLTGTLSAPVVVLSILHVSTDFLKASYERNPRNAQETQNQCACGRPDDPPRNAFSRGLFRAYPLAHRSLGRVPNMGSSSPAADRRRNLHNARGWLRGRHLDGPLWL